MRPIDADALHKSFEEVYEHPDSILRDSAWWFFGKLEDAPTITPPPNDPLAPDELRKMVGKPVYIIDNECGHDGRWVIWDNRHSEFWLRGHNADTYGVSWRAYRHEPEESQGGEER